METLIAQQVSPDSHGDRDPSPQIDAHHSVPLEPDHQDHRSVDAVNAVNAVNADSAASAASAVDAVDAVDVRGLTKRYRGRTAVDNLSFTVPAGAVAGLIGPNGAGKTTLMAMLLGLVRPSGGSGSVLGHAIDRPTAYLGRVGASIETPAFHPAVSGVDNLRALAVLGGHDQAQIPELIDRVGLTGRGDERYNSYSMGMKQRLAIAASLLGDPQLVILDEPTNGLDPLGMQDIRRLIGQIAAEGRTIVVSSHLLSELEQVCDWLIVIDHGGLVYLGHPDDLTGTESIVARPVEANDLPALRTVGTSTGLAVTSTGSEIVVTLDDSADPGAVAAQINRDAHAAGINLLELHHRRDDLEARYLDLLANHSISKGPTS